MDLDVFKQLAELGTSTAVMALLAYFLKGMFNKVVEDQHKNTEETLKLISNINNSLGSTNFQYEKVLQEYRNLLNSEQGRNKELTDKVLEMLNTFSKEANVYRSENSATLKSIQELLKEAKNVGNR